MKVDITVEEVDNGILFRWDSEGKTPRHMVWQTDDDKAPKEGNVRRICQEIGKEIFEDIHTFMDDSLCSTVYVKLEYKIE